MAFVPDETLMAYVDGELAAEDCRRLEVMLAADQGLRARLEPFAMTGIALADLFDRPMREPVPDRILAVVSRVRAPTERAKAVRGKRSGRQGLRTLIEPIREALFPSELRLTGAVSGLAFSALFLAGGVTGWVLGQAVAPGAQSGALVMLDGGGLVAAASLRQALETAPSGEAAAQTGAGSSDAIITPLLSFASHDQRYCRQYEISLAAGRSFAGVACRSPDAVWHVAFHAEVEGGKPTQGQRYETASRSGSPALEAVIDTMIKDSALGPDDETALLANGWGSGKE